MIFSIVGAGGGCDIAAADEDESWRPIPKSTTQIMENQVAASKLAMPICRQYYVRQTSYVRVSHVFRILSEIVKKQAGPHGCVSRLGLRQSSKFLMSCFWVRVQYHA